MIYIYIYINMFFYFYTHIFSWMSLIRQLLTGETTCLRCTPQQVFKTTRDWNQSWTTTPWWHPANISARSKFGTEQIKENWGRAQRNKGAFDFPFFLEPKSPLDLGYLKIIFRHYAAVWVYDALWCFMHILKILTVHLLKLQRQWSVLLPIMPG